jgi:hypothetical protein
LSIRLHRCEELVRSLQKALDAERKRTKQVRAPAGRGEPGEGKALDDHPNTSEHLQPLPTTFNLGLK